MKQSPNDHKTYHPLTLSNGLRVLLIHNKETQKSAAALAVNAGHFNDPKDRQGMAHFLEHMLFLGTKKFPDGSEYQKFINQHGGSNNAWTATEHTCFFFDIHHSQLQGALARFSQFFIAPLLSEDFINKERKNIDAEFKLKLKDDIRRLYDVHKETINQKHPFSQFSVGNIDTLADRDNISIRAELLAFYQRYYCANYMTLAIEGPQSIDELQVLAQSLFSDIKSTVQILPVIKEPLYLPKNKQVCIHVCPVKNDQQLIISFAMPSIDQYYRHKPESVLAYLLGHEGPGSILSLLKKNQWAMGLTAGSGINGSNFKDFNISISLTEQGNEHTEEIIDIVFSYINLLKKAPIPEYFYHEKQSIAELSFTYHEKSRPLESVSQLVINMQHYPSEDYVFGDYVMAGLNYDDINQLLSHLSADNLRLVHVSQNTHNDFSFNKTSFWYQVPYQITKIAEKNILKWLTPSLNNKLFLPPKNTYIIANPTVYKGKVFSSTPVCIEKRDGLNIWYKQDTIFKVPKGYLYIGIDLPFSVKSTTNIAMTRLLVDLYSDTLIEENYDAELAGIHYHLYAHQGGVTLQLSGISEKQPELLTKLINSLKRHQVQENHFLLIKQQMITYWKNADKSKSISQLFSTLSSSMQPYNPSSEKLWQALEKVTFEAFMVFALQLFDHVYIDVLIHGNWLKEHAIEISDIIKSTFSERYQEKNAIKYPVLDIRQQGELVMPINLPEHDHASVIYYPQEHKDLISIAKSMVTSHLLSPHFFQVLRTEKQYGYLLGVGYIPINRYPGIAFYVQSPHATPQELIIAMDEFINKSITMISTMSNDDWLQFQQGLAGQLQEKVASLRIKSQRFWAAICNEDALFEHKEQLIEAILSLEIKDIKNFIKQKLITKSNPDRILLISKNSSTVDIGSSLKSKAIENIDEFSKKCARKH